MLYAYLYQANMLDSWKTKLNINIDLLISVGHCVKWLNSEVQTSNSDSYNGIHFVGVPLFLFLILFKDLYKYLLNYS